ncbi:MAG: adenosylmethionine decarboxylase [Planctomycetota bacterium]
MASVGIHCLLEIYGCPKDLLDDQAAIAKTLRDAADHAGATWLGEVNHKFQPCGVTALGLLAESHISIHTWPEIGYAAVDVFTCGDHAIPEKACKYLVEHLRAERHTIARIPRATELRPREVEGVDVHEAHMTTRELSHEILASADG